MSVIFDLIKKEYVSDGASEQYVDEAKSLIDSALNYWITLDQDMPDDQEEVLAIGVHIHSQHITRAIVKYHKSEKTFICGDTVFRVFGWRPLPKSEFISTN